MDHLGRTAPVPRLFVLQAAFQLRGDDRKLRKGDGGGLAPGVIARAKMPAGWRLHRWTGTRRTPSGSRGIEGVRPAGPNDPLRPSPGLLVAQRHDGVDAG